MARQALKNISRLIDIANETGNSSIEKDFIEDLHRSIEIQEEKGWGGLPSQTFKPSGMQCRRASYYQISGVQPDKGHASYNFVGICNSGSDIHIRTQNAIIQMKENGMDCEWVDIAQFIEERNLSDLEIKMKTDTETKLYNKKYNMSFMCDGIVKYKGRYYIVEIKTETSSKWYYREGVDTKHYNQGIAYALNFELSDVLFIYISRDNLESKSYMFRVTDEMKDGLIKYMSDVNGYVERKIAPPKGDIDKRVCSNCIYIQSCKKDR